MYLSGKDGAGREQRLPHSPTAVEAMLAGSTAKPRVIFARREILLRSRRSSFRRSDLSLMTRNLRCSPICANFDPSPIRL